MPPRALPGGGSGAPTIAQAQFVDAQIPLAPGSTALGTRNFNTVPLAAVTDPNGLFRNAQHTYIVPSPGIYRITARIRAYDYNLWAGWANGDSFGINVGKQNIDETTMNWQTVNVSPLPNKRQTFLYQRESEFAKGDALRLYVYIDSATANYQISGAEMSISQLAKG